MKLPTQKYVRADPPGSFRLIWPLLVGMVALTACATQPGMRFTPPPLHQSDTPVQIADIDVLAVTPEMEAFLERYVLPYRNLDTRLDLLTLAVIENGVLGFSYSDGGTLTAEETFNNRSGNCISHANMLVALARRAGLDAQFQQIVTHPQWISRDDTLMRSEHINVVIKRPNSRHYVDVSGTSMNDHLQRIVLSDRDSKGMYYNNLGAEALIKNDLSTAYAFIVKAIETAPGIADPWVNLGVVFSRNGQLEEAEISQKTALQIESDEYSAMSNLHAIYTEQNRVDDAERLRKKVENYRRKNPYYLLMLGNEALEASRFKESISWLKRAVKRKNDDHRLHFALARAQYLSGNQKAAEKSLLRARKVAPADSVEDYSLPPDAVIPAS